MRCVSCGFENAEGVKLCVQCSTTLLGPRCPQCGSANPPGAAFCGQCAAALTGSQKGKERPGNRARQAKGQKAKKQSKVQRTAQSAVRTPQSTQSPAPSTQPLDPRREGERRQLTVMFCDLVGSTPLAEKLDPEELREVVEAYHALCATVIDRFAGHIAQYIGDGVVVYFGYPLAHEDDVQRAVRAGLEILAELHALNTRLQHSIRALQEVPLQLRIGIHTGLVVVGEMGRGARREPIALGETPNIAARVQGIAAPDTLTISSATYQLTRGFFQCLDLGSQGLKGVSTPVPVYQVVAESGAQSRFEVALTKGLTPLVGREQEVGLLLERWEQVKESRGQVVLLRGEPGIGKSRLVQELKERVAKEEHLGTECRCSLYYQNSAFYPVIDLLQRVLRFRREDSPEEKLSKLEKALAPHSFSLPEAVPLLALLLSLPLLDRYVPLTLTPQRQKQKLLEVLLALLLKTAETQPVLAVWEDLQWADPSTVELLTLLMDQVPTARIFFVLTFRPEFHLPWAIRSHMIQLTLNRLPRKQAEAMVERVTGGKILPAEVLRQLVEKTDGIPLFVEELTKMVLESGLLKEEDGRYVEAASRSPLPLAIPATLHDSLMARLDRLGTAKEVAQLGATLGREFTYDVLQAVSPLEEVILRRELSRLVDTELVYQRGLPPQARYLFKHALIQGAAYESLLKSRRQHYHQQIAQVLEERFPETVEIHPELLAHHYTEAGLRKQAVLYWQKAGQRGIERSANVEAVSHLTKGLELLKTLPDTPEHTLQELMLQVTLGGPLMAAKGFAAPEVEQAFTRARELCQQTGETPQLFPVLRGLAAFYSVRAEYKTTRELAEQCLRLAQRQQDPLLLLSAHFELGVALFCLGEFVQAREHWEHSLAFYDLKRYRSHAFLYGQDLGVSCLSRMVRVLWFLGYPDQALKRSQEAIALAQEQSHPFSLAYALNFATECHRLRGEVQAAQERAEAASTLSIDQGFPIWATAATMLHGWVLAEQGHGEEGIAQIRQGLVTWRAMGAEMARPHWLALLAEVHGKVGQAAEGLPLLTEALEVVDHTGEREYEAELYRLKGKLLLQSAEREVRNAE